MSHGDLNVYSGLRVIRDVCKKADIVQGKLFQKKTFLVKGQVVDNEKKL